VIDSHAKISSVAAGGVCPLVSLNTPPLPRGERLPLHLVLVKSFRTSG